MGAVPALAQDLAQDIVQLPVAAAAVHVTPDVTETSSPAVVSPAAVPPRNRADAAATVALAALLPHLANNDTIPLMDRSAMFAGDLNRALTGYDVSQSTLAAAEKAVTDKKTQVVLRHAMHLLGTPYRWGGTSLRGFDCSGLVNYVFRTALGIELPRVSRDMARHSGGELIKDRKEVRTGDLVFFGKAGRITHVGIVLDNGLFLHAPRTGKDVRMDSFASGYWSHKFIQARRVL
ncbi:C40 family peptidase [Xylella taiwanensis]|uniref:C40 family peptidase n=2 Tax=Xylella taiwanensis TaxID=1444770 RepID=Z9JI58_9GAMM|nr:C40 family peptidase [Xylella taiwanensis]EWS77879.1 cell-wall hydrolase [Xylella taiwanensis]MCD8457120.1 C40 family peptidase [Xylella taiwanensis]MCD8459528.1 C40 family peptidase [Xylella taiwanensis]MCD8461604.1 C40 family peptidase [Xylella taiwanensis]MCD8462369.1 C40 family peptidase [Xylella taiwanensis]